MLSDRPVLSMAKTNWRSCAVGFASVNLSDVGKRLWLGSAFVAVMLFASVGNSEAQIIPTIVAGYSYGLTAQTSVILQGYASRSVIENTTLEEWRRIDAVNLDGPFLGCKHAIPLIAKAGGGAIVNISSVAGLIGARDSAAYCASKGGVRLLTKSVALHCAHRKNGVRCNSIHPVYTDTPMVGQMLAEARSPEKMLEALKAMIPIGRLGTPEELAAMAVFLVSDEARFVTGAEFVFDGGYTAN